MKINLVTLSTMLSACGFVIAVNAQTFPTIIITKVTDGVKLLGPNQIASRLPLQIEGAIVGAIPTNYSLTVYDNGIALSGTPTLTQDKKRWTYSVTKVSTQYKLSIGLRNSLTQSDVARTTERVVNVELPLVRRYSPGERPIVIAHRGASKYCPDHTRASYDLAINQGADYIEQDVYFSRDGVPFVMHGKLTDSTNVKVVFPGRSSYNVTDFTKAELKRLKSVMGNNAATGAVGFAQCQNGMGPLASVANPFDVLTLEEAIDFVMEKSQTLKGDSKAVGLYIEFRSFSDTNIKAILNMLWSKGYTQNDKIFIQSWYFNDLSKARLWEANRGILFPHVLLGYSGPIDAPNDTIDLLSVGRVTLESIKEFTEGISINFGSYGAARKIVNSDFANTVHSKGFFIHPWYFTLPTVNSGVCGNANISAYFDIGLDGVFTDCPDVGRRAVDARYRTSAN